MTLRTTWRQGEEETLADKYFNQQEYGKALMAYYEEIKKNPDDEFANLGRAYCLYSHSDGGDHYADSAEQLANYVITINPKNLLAYKLKEKIYSDNPDFNFYFTETFRILNREVKKINYRSPIYKDYIACITVATNYMTTHNASVSIKFLPKYNKAIQMATEMIKLAPNEYKDQYHTLRGDLYLKNKDYDLALEDLNKAIEINPYYHSAYALRSAVYSKKKDHKLALRDLPYCMDDDENRLKQAQDIVDAALGIDASTNIVDVRSVVLGPKKKIILERAKFYKKLIDTYNVTVPQINVLRATNETVRVWLLQTWRQLITKKDLDENPVSNPVQINDENNGLPVVPNEIWDIITSYMLRLDNDIVNTKKIRDILNQRLERTLINEKDKQLEKISTLPCKMTFFNLTPDKAKEKAANEVDIINARSKKRINF